MRRPAHDWDETYRRDDAPPWDIGRPQPVFQQLADDGLFIGAFLDSGCGTGEHTLLAATLGADAFGADLSSVAIDIARRKASERNVDARFEAGDILELALPEHGFDTVLDSGLFHSFDDADRARYVDVLRRATKPGARLILMCFSDRQPGDWGPRRVTRAELETAFAEGWQVERLEPSTFVINPFAGVEVVDAWLLVATRAQA
jgi:SAM-dependent methyltransferase